MSFLRDFLDGRYPEYDLTTFARDIAYSIISQAAGRRISKIEFCAELCQSHRYREIVTIISTYLNDGIVFSENDELSANDLLNIVFADESSDCGTEYYKFNQFLKEYNKGKKEEDEVVCSKNDFSFLRLMDLYLQFKNR